MVSRITIPTPLSMLFALLLAGGAVFVPMTRAQVNITTDTVQTTDLTDAGDDTVRIRDNQVTYTIQSGVTVSNTGDSEVIQFHNAGADGSILINMGTIQKTGTEGFALKLNDGIEITIRNSGLITSTNPDGDATISDDNEDGILNIFNTGIIIGDDDDAILIEGDSQLFLTNSGTIRSDGSEAIRIDDGDATAEITNSGTITSSDAEAIQLDDGDDTVTNNSGGTISSSADVAIKTGEGDDTINNNGGTIQSTADVAIESEGGNDTINNNGGTIFSDSDDAIYSDAAGMLTIVNSGTIESTDSEAIRLDDDGADNDASAMITNSGTITSSGAEAIQLENLDDTINNNGGTIFSSADVAIKVAGGDDTITNSGTIESTADDAILKDEDGSLTLVNSGTITSSDSEAVRIDDGDASADITNQAGGTISATSAEAIQLNDQDDIVRNMGLITSFEDDEVTLKTGEGDDTIINSGIISAAGADPDAAIEFEDGDNVLHNTGTITTTSGDAIRMDDTELRITAFGNIDGNIDGRGDNDSDLIIDIGSEEAFFEQSLQGFDDAEIEMRSGTLHIVDDGNEEIETKDLTITGGFLDIGTAPSRITITDDLTLDNNGKLRFGRDGVVNVGDKFEIESGGTTLVMQLGTRINAADDVLLDGSLVLENLSGQVVENGETRTIISAGAGTGGDFNSIQSPFPTMEVTGAFAGQDYQVTFNRDYNNAELLNNLSPNGKEVFSALAGQQNTNNGDLNEVFNEIDQLTSFEEVDDAAREISPEKMAFLSDFGQASARLQTSNVFDRLNNLSQGRVGGARYSSYNQTLDGYLYDSRRYTASNSNSPAIFRSLPGEAAKPNNVELFLNVSGLLADRDSDTTVTGYNSYGVGATIGADYVVSDNFVVGLATGYGHQFADLEGGGGEISVSSIPVTGYASYYNQSFYAHGMVGYTYHSFDNERNIRFGAINRTADSDVDAHQLTAAIRTGYDFETSKYVFGPMVSGEYNRLWTQSYTESGAGALNLNVDSTEEDSMLSGVGWRLAYKIDHDEVQVFPEISMAWKHEFFDTDRALNARLANGGNAFQTNVNGLEQDYGEIRMGMTTVYDDSISWNMGLGAQVGRAGYQEVSLNAGVRYKY